MKQARGALAVALVLSASRTVGAEPCVPRASLAGDAAEVARVAAELQRLGVAVDRATSEPSSRCEVAAAVEPDRAGGVSVAVRDASHRSEGRVLSDATLAAVWIDSWVHDDDLGPPPSEPDVHAPGTVAAIGAGAPVIAGERVAFGAGYEEAWTDDGSAWSGFAAGACVRTGAFCFGVRVRYARQQVTANLTSAARTDESALATASWSHVLGRMQVTPEIGVGVGRLSTDRVDGCAPAQPVVGPPTCDPSTDPTCPPTMPPPPQPCTVSPDGTATGPVYVGDGFGQTTYTPRGEAALHLAVPLFEHVWLEGHASVTLAPFGHGASYLPPPPVNSTGTTAPFTPQQLALPGDPQTAVQLGIGLTVTAP